MADELTVFQLLERCRQRPLDEAAWNEFVRRYDPAIRAHVARTFRVRASQETDRRPQFPDNMIDDLVQAVYVRLVEQGSLALKRFQGNRDNSIYYYLGVISMNVVRDSFREAKAYKRPKVSFSLDELLEPNGESVILKNAISDIDGRAVTSLRPSFTIEEIESALNRSVSRKHRDRDTLIFQLRHFEGLTLEEIQRSLGLNISPVGIGSILNRITSRLRERLKR